MATDTLLRPSPRRSRGHALSVELLGGKEVHNGHPSCCATLGQNLSIQRLFGVQASQAISLRIGDSQEKGNRSQVRLPTKDLVLVQKIKPRA
jgi:hypothetical protein